MIAAHLVPLVLALMPTADDGLDAAARDAVEAAVVPLLIEDAAGNVRGRGTAFLVSADGFLLTNHHVTKGAHAASVLLGRDDDGDGERVPVELWAIRADLDLALLRLAPDADLPRDVPFLELALADPPEGATVHAAGFPVGSGFTITTGVVRGLLDPSQVTLTRRGEALAPAGHWVETTAPIRQGNSGGPLLDGRGVVVGVNTWMVTKGADTNLALSWSDARTLLDAGRQGEMIGFIGLARDRALSVLAADDLPAVPLGRRYGAGDVQSAVGAMRSSLACRACRGRGELKGAPCVRCAGDGLGPAPAAWRAATRVASRAAALREDEPRPRDRLDEPLRQVFDQSAWQRAWDEHVRARALQMLSDPAAATGEPIVIVGRVVVSAPGRTVIMVDRRTVVCVAGARLEASTDGLHAGDQAVAGGLLAGVAGDGVVVVQGGFIVE
jgi:S1-C subfamily serine protease